MRNLIWNKEAMRCLLDLLFSLSRICMVEESSLLKRHKQKCVHTNTVLRREHWRLCRPNKFIRFLDSCLPFLFPSRRRLLVTNKYTHTLSLCVCVLIDLASKYVWCSWHFFSNRHGIVLFCVSCLFFPFSANTFGLDLGWLWVFAIVIIALSNINDI